MHDNAANIAVICIVSVTIVVLIVIIILAAVYGQPTDDSRYIYIDTDGENKRYRAARRRNNNKKLTNRQLRDEGDAKALLNGDAAAMVMVFADWCGFSKKMQSVFDAIAGDDDNEVTMVKINAVDAPQLLDEYQITGYPVLITNFGDKKYIGYKDVPAVRQIMRAASSKRQQSPARYNSMIDRRLRQVDAARQRIRKQHAVRFQVGTHSELTDESDVRSKLRNDALPTIVMVFADWCGYCKKMKAVWNKLQQYAIDNGVQLHSINYKNASDLCRENNINGFPAMLSNFGQRKYSGYVDENTMKEIIDSH